MIKLDFSNLDLKIQNTQDKTTVYDPIRKKWIVLSPEEHVRQYIVLYIITILKYPIAKIAIEKSIKVGTLNKRFDIVVYDNMHQPWLLIECKAHNIPISEITLYQLLNYHSKINCKYWVLTNGIENYCADATDCNNIKWLSTLPGYCF